MLQYILTESDKYSVAELAQMAVEGGCGWINLSLPGYDDAALRSTLVPDVVDMCRDAGIFLTIDDNIAICRELGLHGVRITLGGTPAGQELSPAALRDELGPEAVIGIETADASSLPAMMAADIDFVCVPERFDDAARKAFIEKARQGGATIPVVAQGDITPETAPHLLAEGFNGVAVSRYVTDAASPVEAMEVLMKSIAL